MRPIQNNDQLSRIYASDGVVVNGLLASLSAVGWYNGPSMNRIRLLSEQVANQIAAGEVVERPASVVKELVENALDARATRIVVEVHAGGRSLIRVTDDGIGMSKDDALLCLERHATSKIRRAEDLDAIATMGFRGEALPSIASVSRFTLTTKERDSGEVEATQVIVQGGRISEVRAAAGSPGTSVEIRSLFFNLPARRKFLRSEETERAHIQHYLTLAALAYPGIGFTFINDQRVVWQLPPAPSAGSNSVEALRERWAALHPGETKLLALDETEVLALPRSEETPENESAADSCESRANLRVWGLIGSPGVARASREDQHLFVNFRPVENRGLNHALIEGYHTALMKGRFPVCCLFLEIDPGLVDVNIHPSKREVKFRAEGSVRRAVADAVRRTLLRFHSGVGLSAPERPQPAGNVPVPADSTIAPEARQTTFLPDASLLRSASLPSAGPAGASTSISQPVAGNIVGQGDDDEIRLQAGSASGASSGSGPSDRAASTAVVALPSAGESSITNPVVPRDASASPGTVPPPSSSQSQPQSQTSSAPVPLLHVPLRLVGVVGRLYVVLESDRGLVLLDQHAAHERILFEQMLKRLEQGNAPSQRLLLAETVELGPRDAQFLRENLAVLGRLGVGLSEFGERTFLLDALPPMVRAGDPRRFVLELVDELKAAGEGVNAMRLGEHTIAKTVCRHAVKANDPLAGPELESLVEDLRRCDMPYTCPHGRPTLIEMNFRELEKKFGRIQ